MKIEVMIAAVILFIFPCCFAGNPIEQYAIWQKQPINIVLPIGKARKIIFPNVVKFGMPRTLNKKLRITNNAGVLKLTAQKPFIGQRAEVLDKTSGRQILLNLSADKNQTNVPVAIFYHKQNVSNQIQRGYLKTPKALIGEMAYITLTRHAEQQLYSPKRLLKNPYGIRLINSFADPRGKISSQNWFYGFFIDRSTINMPWAEWFGEHYYVTAVLVRNALNIPLDLNQNITNICGRTNGLWNAVTFFPSWKLKKAGSEQDTTMVFLISEKPFDEIVKICEGA